ncbi:MAG: hypothetical protein JWP44_4514 [Mucilaginibacter sp.]|nr:hypothetical protein [Mucilaginibacter sp.]
MSEAMEDVTAGGYAGQDDDEGYYTKAEALKVLDISTRTFTRWCKHDKVPPAGLSKTKPHVNLYTKRSIHFLKALHAERTIEDGEDDDEETAPDGLVPAERAGPDIGELVAMIERFHSENMEIAARLGKAEAERDSAKVRVGELTAQLGAAETERDGALAQNRSLQEHLSRLKRWHWPWWRFWGRGE